MVESSSNLFHNIYIWQQQNEEKSQKDDENTMHHIKTTKMAATMLVLKVVGSRKKRNSFAYNIYNFLDDLVLCDLLLFVQIFCLPHPPPGELLVLIYRVPAKGPVSSVQNHDL